MKRNVRLWKLGNCELEVAPQIMFYLFWFLAVQSISCCALSIYLWWTNQQVLISWKNSKFSKEYLWSFFSIQPQVGKDSFCRLVLLCQTGLIYSKWNDMIKYYHQISTISNFSDLQQVEWYDQISNIIIKYQQILIFPALHSLSNWSDLQQEEADYYIIKIQMLSTNIKYQML